MKKKLTLIVAAIAILFTACTKDGENPIITDSSWTFNGAAHFSIKSVRTDATAATPAKVVFTDENKGKTATLTVYFKTFPRTDGTYAIVKNPTTGLTDTQCAITATEGSSPEFLLSVTAASAAKVTFTGNGKIKIDIPEISLSTATGTENYKLVGSVVELN